MKQKCSCGPDKFCTRCPKAKLEAKFEQVLTGLQASGCKIVRLDTTILPR